MAEARMPVDPSGGMLLARLEARRAAAQRVRRSAAALVADAGAGRARADELRRQLEARRLRAARSLGSATKRETEDHVVGGG